MSHREDCENKSFSSARGNCAAKFGVCCVFETSACGATVSDNCTYVTNPSYPDTDAASADDGAALGATCDYTISKMSSDICHVRLDFLEMSIEQPVLTPNTGATIYLHTVELTAFKEREKTTATRRKWPKLRFLKSPRTFAKVLISAKSQLHTAFESS